MLNSYGHNAMRNNCRTVQLLVVMLVCLLSSLVQARSYDDLMVDGTILIGVYRDFPPYSYEEQGQAKGLDVELAQAIAAGLGLKLELYWMIADENLDDDLRNHVWKGHYLARDERGPMLKRNVADVMLRVPYDRDFAYKIDPDGRVINDLVHFFAPYQRERWALTYDSEQLDPFENLAIFQYDKVGVEIDSLPDFYLSGAFRGRLLGNVKHFGSTQLALQAIDANAVSAVMGMQSQLQWGIPRLARSEQMLVADVPFPNLVKRSWDVGMAVKDSYRQLAYAVEDIVDGMVKSGQFAKLYQGHGVVYSKPDRYRLDAPD